MIIIPAIDMIDGSCVRLTQGDYSRKTVYNEDPLEVAKMFEDWGLQRLHLVDLDGAKEGRIINFRQIERIRKGTSLTIDFGGGLKSDSDLAIAFDSGADMVTGGSIAVKDPERFLSWLEKYGSNKIILGADHKNGKISISGWTEHSDLELISFISGYLEKGVKKVICTDISVDGMLSGPSTKYYSEIIQELAGIQLIASGGIGNFSHIEDLSEIGVKEVIVGKAIYEGKINSKDIANLIKK